MSGADQSKGFMYRALVAQQIHFLAEGVTIQARLLHNEFGAIRYFMVEIVPGRDFTYQALFPSKSGSGQ